MPSSRPLSDCVQIIRPLLTVRRVEIERFLNSFGQTYRTDSSNQDTSLTRNFLRQELLPLLEQRLNPQVREHLWRLTQQASEWHDVMQQQAANLLDGALLDESPTTVRLRCEPFANQPRPLLREAFVLLWIRHSWPRQAMTYSHWDALANMAQPGQAAQSTQSMSVNLPGRKTAVRRGGLLAIECR
jgi:tRNA(Ile)-lysidine synthase